MSLTDRILPRYILSRARVSVRPRIFYTRKKPKPIVNTVARMLFISYANESSQLDENLLVRSQFYSDHRVNLSTYRYCQSATFGPLAFCVCSLIFTILNQKEFRIATVAMFTSDLNAGVVPQMSPPPHDLKRLRTTMVDFIVLSIKLVFMVLGVSYSRVLAQRPTGCCSASNNNTVYLLHDISPKARST